MALTISPSLPPIDAVPDVVTAPPVSVVDRAADRLAQETPGKHPEAAPPRHKRRPRPDAGTEAVQAAVPRPLAEPLPAALPFVFVGAGNPGPAATPSGPGAAPAIAGGSETKPGHGVSGTGSPQQGDVPAVRPAPTPVDSRLGLADGSLTPDRQLRLLMSGKAEGTAPATTPAVDSTAPTEPAPLPAAVGPGQADAGAQGGDAADMHIRDGIDAEAAAEGALRTGPAETRPAQRHSTAAPAMSQAPARPAASAAQAATAAADAARASGPGRFSYTFNWHGGKDVVTGTLPAADTSVAHRSQAVGSLLSGTDRVLAVLGTHPVLMDQVGQLPAEGRHGAAPDAEDRQQPRHTHDEDEPT